MLKIIITNIITHNGGDAAIMCGMLVALKKYFSNNTQFKVFVDDPDFCRKMYPELECEETLGRQISNTRFSRIRFLGRRWRKLKQKMCMFLISLEIKGISISYIPIFSKIMHTLREYRNADIVISCGGTYLLEEYGITTQYIDYKIIHLLNKPLFLYTQSIGAFHEKHNINMLSDIIAWSSGIFLRDQLSLGNILKIEPLAKERCYVCDDAAFSLFQSENFQKKSYRFFSAFRIGVSVREWKHGAPRDMEHYRKSIATLLEHLAEKGHQVVFVSTCQGNADYTDDNDEVNEICKMLSPEVSAKFEYYREALPFQKVQQILSTCDLVVATRLHMAILALLDGIPVLPIAYEFKTSELFLHKIGYEKVWNLSQLIPNEFCEYADEFIKNIEHYSNLIHEKIPSMAKNSFVAAEKISTLFRERE